MDSIPSVGYGLWKIPREQCADLVYDAIAAGYRHLDSACDYGNEKEVGEGIRRALADGLCTREELWVTSKLWNTYHAAEHVEPALQRTLDDLGLEYLDLYLIHFPIAQAFVPFEDRYPPEWFFDPDQPGAGVKLAPISLAETWAAMEAMQRAGHTRQIGVCNYNTALFRDLLNYARIKPAMLQIEAHPYYVDQDVVDVCREFGIVVQAYSPLGNGQLESRKKETDVGNFKIGKHKECTFLVHVW